MIEKSNWVSKVSGLVDRVGSAQSQRTSQLQRPQLHPEMISNDNNVNRSLSPDSDVKLSQRTSLAEPVKIPLQSTAIQSSS